MAHTKREKREKKKHTLNKGHPPQKKRGTKAYTYCLLFVGQQHLAFNPFGFPGFFKLSFRSNRCYSGRIRQTPGNRASARVGDQQSENGSGRQLPVTAVSLGTSGTCVTRTATATVAALGGGIRSLEESSRLGRAIVHTGGMLMICLFDACTWGCGEVALRGERRCSLAC